MAYSIKTNRCKGWHQPIFYDANGKARKGAKWPTQSEAYDAIMHHYHNGVFPSEVEEQEIVIHEGDNKCPSL